MTWHVADSIAKVREGGEAAMKALVERWAEACGDVLRDHPRRFPEIMLKAVAGRALYGLGPGAFFMADLHNRPFRTWRDHMAFSDGFLAGIRTLNGAEDGFAIARDKVVTSERCVAHGIACAPILTVVGRDLDRFPAAGTFPHAGSVGEVIGALASAPDHLFIKPAADQGGEGVAVAERVGSTWRFDGDGLSDHALATRLRAAAPAAGLLVQPRLDSHRVVAALTPGAGLSTLRLLVALTPGGARVLCAVLKLLGGDALADNFHGGTTGNLIGAVDLASGRIVAAYGRKPGRHVLLEPVTRHPVSGAQLVGVELPLWNETLDLAERAARAFPEIPLPGLDIAITADGPVVLETNTEWSTAGVQLAVPEGLRSTLRRAWPDLAADEHVKTAAASHFML